MLLQPYWSISLRLPVSKMAVTAGRNLHAQDEGSSVDGDSREEREGRGVELGPM